MNLSGRMALSTYRAVGYGFRGLAPLFLGLRGLKGKELSSRRKERYGTPSLARPNGPLVWIHAASVGETNSVIPLIEQIVEIGARVLFTSGTVTSAAIAEKRLPKGAFHQFFPLDIVPYVCRFLDHWRPDMALFVESEMWPVTMSELNQRDIPLIVVNGRMSERSYARWSKVPSAVHQMFGNMPLCLAQTNEDAERYRALGVSNVEVTGNLKFDVPPLGANDNELAAMRRQIGDRPVWIAASTHPGEERLFAEAHRRMALRNPGLLTIIAPRHPERGEDLEKEIRSIVSHVQCRTKDATIRPDTEIYLSDTVGELGLIYRLSRIAFVGGSLVEHGGQNPIEPARLGCAILHGPNVTNFHDIYAALDQSRGAECICSEHELMSSLGRLFASPAEIHRRSELSREALRPFAGALDSTMMCLMPFLNPLKINAELVRSNGS